MRLLKVVAVSAGVLVVLELVARCLRPEDPRFRRGQDVFQAIGGLDLAEVDAIIEGHPDLFWRMKSGVRGRRWLPPLWRDTRSNSLGFRDHELSGSKAKSELRVLCLGDSCTYGSGVPMGDSFPELLEGMLAGVDRTRIFEVINAGFPGYTCFQGFELLKMLGKELQPDIVLASFGFNENSVWSGLTDPQTHARLNKAPLRLLLRSALLRILARPFVGAAVVEGRDANKDQSHSNLGDAPGAALRRMSPELYGEYLEKIIELSLELGARPVLILHPTRPESRTPETVDPRDVPGDFDLQEFMQSSQHMKDLRSTLRDVAQRSGTPLLDLEAPFQDRAECFIDNCHLNRQGCLLQARLLYQLLKNQCLVPPSPPEPGPDEPPH